MASQIDDELSDQERAVLAMYRSSEASEMKRVIRISANYAIAAGIFVYATIACNQPLYALAVYGVLITFLALRIAKAAKLVGIMPGIIEKYEDRIATLSIAERPTNS